MPKYTTGEIAKLCGVSVRTVQFYDAKNLLKPSALSEGGRRLYSDGDLQRLQLICMLKTLGLSLDAIRSIVNSEEQTEILILLLEEQAKQTKKEISERQAQLDAIRTLQQNLNASQSISVQSVEEMERLVQGRKKLKKIHGKMLVLGILMDIIQLVTLLIWIFCGFWQPFAAGAVVVVLLGVKMTQMYCKNTDYICPKCNRQFHPHIWPVLFAPHSARARKLKCPNCAYTGYCVETEAKMDA